MKRRIIDILVKIVLITILLQFCALTNTSKAVSWTEILEDGKEFMEEGKKEDENPTSGEDNSKIVEIIDEEKTKSIVADIYRLLMLLGIAVTVVVGAILGIKFMLSSVEDKAKIKEYMVPYVVGCIVIFGAFAIWKMFVELISSNI